MERTQKQQAVIEAAAAKLKKNSWFRGVCLDNLPSDEEIDREGFEEAVEALVLDTAFWDGPTIGCERLGI